MTKNITLASKIRPQNLDSFFGQEHLTSQNGPLKLAIENRYIFSFILWGPPGVGKTTLARIYAKSLDAAYFELSAVSTGKEDIRKIIDLKQKKPKVIFLDEIHRFNKAQQDFLLPHVETGNLTLIGATTENPSFEIIPALLSRCQIFTLSSLSEDNISKIICSSGFDLSTEAIKYITALANGDARQALSLISKTFDLYKEITIDNIQNTLQNRFLRYDKKTEEHYNTISAFIKSMRASQPNAALYYLARMIESGEDAKFIARRMVIFASEDIGLKDSNALTVANNTFRAVETIGYPESAINLAHATCYLALAPKSKASYYAYFDALSDVKKYGNLEIPFEIRNAPTKLMKELGYGKNYEKYTKEDLLPKKLKGKKYLK